jgi:polar amino acid transport system substrate-binding protein
MYLKVFSLIIGMGFGVALQAQTINMSTGEWPPFTDSTSPNQGIGLAIVTQAFKAVDMEINYDFVPWKRAYSQAKEGRYDATGIWFKNADRETEFYFSDAVLPHENVFFHLKTLETNWQTLTDLKGKVIGATSGYAYGGGFEDMEKAKILSVTRANSDQNNLRKLISKRIDLFPSDIDVGYYLLKNNFTAEEAKLVTHNETVLSSSPTHLLVSKKLPKNIAETIISKFNEGLAKIKISGEYFEILKSVRQ